MTSQITTAIIDTDVFTAPAAERSLAAVVTVYEALFTSVEQHTANQDAMDLQGLTFLAAQREAVVDVLSAAQAAVARAAEHVQRAQDGVGSDPTLAGVVAGTYVDTAGA